ncbi:hypothetical protein FQN57_004038 [Myotisia sp. PD_48]|nr:hypothetical protein FQN57_004038 [Myotisia sp. PD_48]
MTSQVTQVQDSQREESRGIVRRFTQQLNGETQLENLVKAAQETEDMEEKESWRRRMNLIDDSEISDFLEAAEGLNGSCRKVSDNLDAQKSRWSFFKPRPNARAKANEMLKENWMIGLDDLNANVYSLQDEWKKRHGPVYRNFKKICEHINDHKSVLATILPAGCMYTSLLSGTLSLLVHAAVSHTEIAAGLTEAVADISARATCCAKILDIIDTEALRSRLSRAWASFNENVNSRFKDAQSAIDRHVSDMHNEAFVHNHRVTFHVFKMLAGPNGDQDAIREMQQELRLQRQDYKAGIDSGKQMLEGLKEMFIMFQAPQLHHKKNKQKNETGEQIVEDVTVLDDITREQAWEYGKNLEQFFVGDSGPLHFSRGQHWLSGGEDMIRIQDWIKKEAKSSTLWISSEPEPGAMTGAKAAAMTVVATAWNARVPIISHFCERPHRSRVPEGQNSEQNGMIGMVYSLIHQLLQFRVRDDPISISGDVLEGLDGSIGSWTASLSVLRDLLRCTPTLSYCVIHGFDRLERSRTWCRNFLEILFEPRQDGCSNFKILMTTSGQSGVLAKFISRRTASAVP